MKKFITILAILGIIFSVAISASAEKPIEVTVGGEYLYTDVDPIIVEGRTLSVPYLKLSVRRLTMLKQKERLSL